MASALHLLGFQADYLTVWRALQPMGDRLGSRPPVRAQVLGPNEAARQERDEPRVLSVVLHLGSQRLTLQIMGAKHDYVAWLSHTMQALQIDLHLSEQEPCPAADCRRGQ